MAPWKKVFVNPSSLADRHLRDRFCHECHSGDPASDDMTKAHSGIIRNPSYPDASAACSPCHDISFYTNNNHRTLYPFRKRILDRSGGNLSLADQAMDRHCGACHASCGECHVSRPATAGGGLLNGHSFMKTPPMRETCTACHGTRVGAEYYGQNPGLQPDIHHERKMTCTDCHSKKEIHGKGERAGYRYMVSDTPRCITCHQKIYTSSPSRKVHVTHKNRASCQVCHSQAYKNCFSCHVSFKNGKPVSATSPSRMDFRIGLNNMKSSSRPEKFVVLRHAPVDRSTFDSIEKNALKNFDSMPTWHMATPHNIRRKTPQNSDCNACHGNAKLFLKSKDVEPDFSAANRSVVVEDAGIPGRRK